MKLSEIARIAGCELVGDPATEIKGIADIEHAGPDEIAFVSNPRYAKYLSSTRAAAVLVPRDMDARGASCALLRCANPSLAFARVAALFVDRPPEPEPGVSAAAVVGEGCTIHESASVGAGSVLGKNVYVGARSVIMPLAYLGDGVRVGTDCRIHPNVTVYAGCTIGDRVVIHAGSVIGSDGFGYEREGEIHVKIPQLGTVEVGDDVEIGACVTVDRARFGKTVIGAGTKIDNLVQVAHNVRIGKNCIIVAQTGISGSTEIGDGVVMAGRAGTFGHIRIGDGAVLTACTVASKDVPAGETVAGFPARPFADYRRSEALRLKLPALLDRIRELEKRVESLEKKAEDD